MVRDYNIRLDFTNNVLTINKDLVLVTRDNLSTRFNLEVEDIENGSLVMVFMLDNENYNIVVNIVDHKGSYAFPNSVLNTEQLKIGFKYIGDEILTINKLIYVGLDEELPDGEAPTPEELSEFQIMVATLNELNRITQETTKEAKDLVADIERRLEQGEFKGEKGDKGDKGEKRR